MSSAESPAWTPPWLSRPAAPQAPPPPEQRPGPGRPPHLARPRGTDSLGYSQPAPWSDDGGSRREPVLDTDRDPPRVVRRVGWNRCLRCSRSFFSEDVVAQRLCSRCKAVLND